MRVQALGGQDPASVLTMDRRHGSDFPERRAVRDAPPRALARARSGRGRRPLPEIRARNMVLEAILESQSSLLGLATGIHRWKWRTLGLQETAEILLRLVFLRMGGDFERPTRSSLVKAIDILQGSGNFLELGPVLLPSQARRVISMVRKLP